MRTMYDSVTSANIPTSAEMVAGYVNGRYAWSAADWARFPRAVHVGIAVRASFNGGQVLDVETGDATPAEVPGWLRMRRAAGVDPTVYCNRSTWPAVMSACAAAGAAQPHYWIATGNRQATIPAGAVAAQHSLDVRPDGFPGTVDISAVADYWPGIDPPQASNGGPAASTTGVELMERITVTPPNDGENSVRLNLPGGANCKVIVRPELVPGKKTVVAPMWVGHIYAWGQDGAGIGHDPAAVKGYNARLDNHREYELPGALWCDLNYSASRPFVIDVVG